MGNQKIRGKDLSKIGVTNNKERSIIIDLANKYFKNSSKGDVLTSVQDVYNDPLSYKYSVEWSKLVNVLLPSEDEVISNIYELNQNPDEFYVCGRELISSNAWQQMNLAMKLPISVKGALMPDAHQGYGLPIGGVLATDNAVIPFGVGMDIGCMMYLSIFPESSKYIERYKHQLKETLKKRTFFGTGIKNDNDVYHEILDDRRFKETNLLKKLQNKAPKQLGTSGSGNHFVEFGIVSLESDNKFGLEKGEYLSLLSHSGSRGLGAEVARHYTDIALQKCILPQGSKHLAWLDLNSEEGAEYWISMNLAIDFAIASHSTIHDTLSRSLGLKPKTQIYNVHNKANFEMVDGKSLVVHRKGATQAGVSDLGIIPGSMATPGYIVEGKGYSPSLNSASHGAGRKFSRQAAKDSISGSMMKKFLKEKGVTLIGGSRDEAPMAYKDIERVIDLQHKQVNILGKFIPKIVKMDKA